MGTTTPSHSENGPVSWKQMDYGWASTDVAPTDQSPEPEKVRSRRTEASVLSLHVGPEKVYLGVQITKIIHNGSFMANLHIFSKLMTTAPRPCSPANKLNAPKEVFPPFVCVQQPLNTNRNPMSQTQINSTRCRIF